MYPMPWPPQPQFGSLESLAYREFMKKVKAVIDEIFVMLKDSGPKPPSAVTDNPAAAGQAALSLQIDTEKKPAAPVVDAAMLDKIRAKWLEVKELSRTVMEDHSFPTSDKDRVFQQLYGIVDQFRMRGINLD